MELALYDTDLKFFTVNDRHYALDIPSSTIFEIHPWVKQILIQSVKNYSTDYLEDLKREFNFLDWMDMAGEINYLIDNRYLTTYSSRITPYELKEQKINSLTLNICHDCNMHCTYCYQKDGRFGQAPEYMSKDIAVKSIELLFNESPDSKLFLNISGGEPLLHPDLVMEIIQIAREFENKYEKQLVITLTSNGTLINDSILEQLKSLDTELIITIEGLPEEHNLLRKMGNKRPSYDLIYDRLQEVKMSGIKYRVKGIIHSLNVGSLNHIFEMYEKAEFPVIQMQPIIAKEGTDLALTDEDIALIKEHYSWLLKSFSNKSSFCNRLCNLSSAVWSVANKKNLGYTCGAGKHYLCVTPSGKVYPCHLLVGFEEFCLGNIMDGSLNQRAREKFYQPLHVLNRDSCSKCWARYFCGGGCVGENFLVNRNLTTVYKPRCEINKFVFEKAVHIYCSNLQDEDFLSFVPKRRKSGREIYKIG